MNRTPANSAWAVVAIVALAAAARGGALWKYGHNLAADDDSYHAIAKKIVADFAFASPGPPAHLTAYRPPLYPWLLAAVNRASGDGAFERALGGLHLLLGTGTVLLTIALGRRLGLGRGSLLAGLLVAVDPVLIYNTTLTMTETTATFLATLFLWLLARGRSGAERTAAGFVFGLCCLCRPTFWAFGVLAGAGWLIDRFSHGRTAAQPADPAAARAAPAWLMAVNLALGTAVVVLPWVVRNTLVFGRPILTTTHGGYTLLLGHNPVYTREVVDRPWGTVWDGPSQREWVLSLEKEMSQENPPLDGLQRPADEVARDRWMYEKAWQYIRDEPGTAVRSGLTLLGRFWNIVPLETGVRSIPNPTRWAIGAFYIVTMLAMLGGILRVRRDEWLAWWPLIALLASFAAVHSLYWADMRMRAPLIPAIALLAVRGVVSGR